MNLKRKGLSGVLGSAQHQSIRMAQGVTGHRGEGVQRTLVFFIGITGALFIMFFLTPDLKRQDLESKYAQAPSEFLVLNGDRVHYRDTGPRGAPSMVLLHGFASSLQTWDNWAQKLEADHRVIRLDLAGFGLTGASADEDYSDLADVQRLEQFVHALDLQEFILVGHSMGGRIAWNYASRYPNRVTHLVLLAPDGYPPEGQKLGDKPYDVGSIAELIQWVLPKWLVKKSLESAFYNPKSLDDALLERYYDMLRAPTVRQSILARMRQTINSDPVDRLQRIKAPTLLLWGQGDLMIPSRNSADYQKALARSEVVILPKAGHLLQEENPMVALSCLLNFIKAHSQSGMMK